MIRLYIELFDWVRSLMPTSSRYYRPDDVTCAVFAVATGLVIMLINDALKIFTGYSPIDYTAVPHWCRGLILPGLWALHYIFLVRMRRSGSNGGRYDGGR